MPRTPITVTETPQMMVVVIGGPDVLVTAARRVVRVELDAGLAVASVADAASVVAEYRPFALLLRTEVYQLDPPEFDALARDVGARVIALDVYGHVERIADEITPLLRAAARARARR